MRKIFVFLALTMSLGLVACSQESVPVSFDDTAIVSAAPSETVPPAPTVEAVPTPTVDAKYSYAQQLVTTLWNELSLYFDNPYAIAAIIGNMSRESRLCPWRYEGDESPNYARSKLMTNLVNEDLIMPTRESHYYFTYFGLTLDARVGFGLCQWTALGYKNQLYEMAVDTNRKIDDPALQVDFLITTLMRDKQDLIELMEKSESSLDCVQLFINFYEKGQTGTGDLLRRHETAEIMLAMFAPEYAMEKYQKMDINEMFKILDIPNYPTEEQLDEQRRLYIY